MREFIKGFLYGIAIIGILGLIILPIILAKLFGGGWMLLYAVITLVVLSIVCYVCDL